MLKGSSEHSHNRPTWPEGRVSQMVYAIVAAIAILATAFGFLSPEGKQVCYSVNYETPIGPDL